MDIALEAYDAGSVTTNYSNIWSNGLLNIRYGLAGKKNISVYDASGIPNCNVWVDMTDRTNVLMRIQRYMARGYFEVQIWNADGSNPAVYRGATTTTPRNIAGTYIIGGADTNIRIGWVHWDSSISEGMPRAEQTGSLATWQFENHLTNEEQSMGLNLANPTYTASSVGPPVAMIQVKGANADLGAIVVRAQRPITLDGSGSYSRAFVPSLKFGWTQLSGPTALSFTNATGPNPTVSNLEFGEYSVELTVRDATGLEGRSVLTFGAVATDDNGVVQHSDPNVALVFGPLLRFGLSPWPWYDRIHSQLSDVYGRLVTNANDKWAADWATPSAGLVSARKGSRTIKGMGTTFQTDVCGGVGNTVPKGPYTVVVMNAGALTYPAVVSACVSDTELTVAPGEENIIETVSGVPYSMTLNGAWWGGASNGAGGSNNANYYDNVMAHYALYYRTGLSRYLQYARTLADRWYDSPFFLRQFTAPRIYALTGTLWRAYEGRKTSWWADKLHPALDRIAADATTGGMGDLREEADQITYLAIAGKLTPDSAKAAAYRSAIYDSAVKIWLPARKPDGNWISSANFYASWNGYAGTATVTNGSTTVTGTGTTWQSTWPWNGNCVWFGTSALNGDPATYKATWVSPTQLMLDRPYQGATATGKKWQLANLCGPGTQPFMVGVAASAWSYAFKADANPMYRDLFFGATAWIRQNGVQASTRGLYYGRGYPNCEPISDNLKNCSYNSLDRGSVEESRFLNGEVLGALASAYEMTSDPGLKQSADDLFGAVFGKEGGPGADSAFVSLLDQSRSGSAPKNFGFFFGAGQVSSWPALRGRIGAAAVTGPAVEITQAVPINPPCVFGLQSLVSIGAAGEVVRIPLTASGAGCVWSASSDVNWAQTYPSSGAGSAAVQCTVFPNFSASPRTAILHISGQHFTIIQAANKNSQAQRFVELLYFNFFGRLPSATERDFQTNQGLKPPTTWADLTMTFLNSPEFNQGGRFIAGLYVGLLSRDAEYAGWLFQRNALSIGVVSPAELVTNFLDADEYRLKFGTPDRVEFTKLLYRNILLREPSPSETSFQSTQITDTQSRSRLAATFLNAPEFRQGTGPRLTTFLLYATLLMRDPTSAERNLRMKEIAANKPLKAIVEEILASQDFVAVLR